MAIVPKFRLPTLDRLGVSAQRVRISESTATGIADNWVPALSTAAQSNDIDTIVGCLLCTNSLWRDVYALTWDIHTFDSEAQIRPFLDAHIPKMKMHWFKWNGSTVRLQKPYPDVVWILLMFDFETNVGLCNAVVRLVPIPSVTKEGLEWKAYAVFTNLDNLISFPELVGPYRNQQRIPASLWRGYRREDSLFANSDPSVLIVGGGQVKASRRTYVGHREG